MSALFCSICQSRIYLNLHHSHLLQIFQGEQLDQGTHPAQSSNRIREEENGGDQMVSKRKRGRASVRGRRRTLHNHREEGRGGDRMVSKSRRGRERRRIRRRRMRCCKEEDGGRIRIPQERYLDLLWRRQRQPGSESNGFTLARASMRGGSFH